MKNSLQIQFQNNKYILLSWVSIHITMVLWFIILYFPLLLFETKMTIAVFCFSLASRLYSVPQLMQC